MPSKHDNIKQHTLYNTTDPLGSEEKNILLTGNIFFLTIPVIQIVEMPKEKLPFISFIHQSLFAKQF